jgi:hypothetical protein
MRIFVVTIFQSLASVLARTDEAEIRSGGRRAPAQQKVVGRLWQIARFCSGGGMHCSGFNGCHISGFRKPTRIQFESACVNRAAAGFTALLRGVVKSRATRTLGDSVADDPHRTYQHGGHEQGAGAQVF